MSARAGLPPSKKILIEKAIRDWMRVRVNRESPLVGGVSGAPVTVVDATIFFPALEQFDPANLHFVIKLSPEESFGIERDKYRLIPKKVRKWFVDIEVPKAVADGYYFMVMPHLEEYQPISFLICHDTETHTDTSLRLVTQAMKDLHFCSEGRPTATREPNFGSALSIYLADIQKSYEKIQISESKNAMAIRDICGNRTVVNGVSINPYLDCLRNLAQALDKISPRSTTWCHGDCHSRNIMIRLDKPDVKFIDYDRLSNQGDYVNDFGTLLADIETYNALAQSRRFQYSFEKEGKNKFSYTLPSFGHMKKAVTFLEGELEKVAKAKNDEYELRLSLSKARYLFGMVLKAESVEKAFVLYFEGLKFLNAALCQ